MRYTAKETSPIYKKLQRIFDVMKEEGIVIELEGPAFVQLSDDRFAYCIMDSEGVEQCNEFMPTLPPNLEWKLSRET